MDASPWQIDTQLSHEVQAIELEGDGQDEEGQSICGKALQTD